jgi:hypothetical protein
MELVEVIYTLKDMHDAAELILDQALIQTNSLDVFQELEWRDTEGNRVYVTDDSARLIKIIDRIKRGRKIYFLGSVQNTKK